MNDGGIREREFVSSVPRTGVLDMAIAESTPDRPAEPAGRESNELQLPTLRIYGFRGLRKVELPHLGRVTLFTGKNGVGKSTVLDAVRLWADRGSRTSIRDLLARRDEFVSSVDEDGDPIVDVDLRAIFNGRKITSDSLVAIGPSLNKQSLTLSVEEPSDEHEREFGRYGLDLLARSVGVLTAKFAQTNRPLPWVLMPNGEIANIGLTRLPYARRRFARELDEREQEDSTFNIIGPGLPDDRQLARFWFKVALTQDEDKAIKGLQLVVGEEVDRIVFIGDDNRGPTRDKRRPVVRHRGLEHPVPLKSFGDGATRILAVALALANSRNGFLLLDEAENGIHYTVQDEYWDMIFQSAHDYNAQVLATTHSADCISSFARAALRHEWIDGELIRLNMFDSVLYADPYSEQQVADASEHSIDLR